MEKANKRKIEFPHTLIIISSIILLAAILTYIVPAGSFDRVTEISQSGNEFEMVVPGSYTRISQQPVGIMQFFQSIPQGFIDTGWISFLVLIVGGTFHVVTQTNAIQAFLNSILKDAGDKSIYFIPVIVFMFSLLPTFIGTLEAYLAFVPLGVLIARSMGLDALVGLSMVVAAGGAGLASGIYNPFTIGTAQEMLGLPVFSVAWLRLIAFIAFNASVSFWTVRYAKKIKADPTQSIVYELEQEAVETEEQTDFGAFETRHILTLLAVVIAMAGLIYKVLNGGDFKFDAPAIFLMLLIVVGVINKITPNELMKLFTKGAMGMVGGILVIGFAKAIGIVLESGAIIDTIVYALSSLLSGTNRVVGGLTMYLIQYITNFFIISGAGQAAVTIPILGPIGEIIGVSKQTIAAAFQFGDGITNLLLPMSPLTAGAIAMAGVSYPDYFKYIWRIILTNTITGAILVGFAAYISL